MHMNILVVSYACEYLGRILCIYFMHLFYACILCMWIYWSYFMHVFYAFYACEYLGRILCMWISWSFYACEYLGRILCLWISWSYNVHTRIGIQKYSKHLTTLFWSRHETFIYLFEFRVSDMRRVRHNFLLCWLFVHRQLSTHWFNQRVGIP